MSALSDTDVETSAKNYYKRHTELVAAFAQLFSGRNDSAVRALEGGSWRVVSKFHQLSDEEIEAAISRRSTTLRSVLCDEQTRFAAITLTHGGKWHSIPALEVLLNCLRSGGITATNLYRESGSEDWLLLAFFDQAVSTDLLQKSLCTLFSRVQIDPEGLKVHSEAERLILPLQPGFAWLHKNGDVLRTREELSLDQALEFFLLDMENGFNSWSDFSQTIAYPANLHVHEVQNSSEETPQIALADGKTRSTTESESVPVSVSPSLSEASLDFSPIPIIEPGPKPVQLKLFDSTSERAPP